MTKLNVLFVCGRNQWRSPTGERIFRKDPRLNVRSAGVSKQSRRQLSGNDIAWADLILVMEKRYEERIRERFRSANLRVIHCLEIPDEYTFMDPTLVELLREGTEQSLLDGPSTELDLAP